MSWLDSPWPGAWPGSGLRRWPGTRPVVLPLVHHVALLNAGSLALLCPVLRSGGRPGSAIVGTAWPALAARPGPRTWPWVGPRTRPENTRHQSERTIYKRFTAKPPNNWNNLECNPGSEKHRRQPQPPSPHNSWWTRPTTPADRQTDRLPYTTFTLKWPFLGTQAALGSTFLITVLGCWMVGGVTSSYSRGWHHLTLMQ